MSHRRTGRAAAPPPDRSWRTLVAAAACLAGSACAPPPDPPTTLDITTELIWCGGVVPPPGEPWCHSSTAARAVEVFQGRSVVASGTSDGSGHLVLEVPAGSLVVAAVDPPVCEQCDPAPVTVAANTSTAVTQTCTVFAP